MSSESAIEQWIEREAATEIKVWVENPETVKDSGFMAKTYTTFRVLLKVGNNELVGVRHRFSEFDSLRDVLKQKYCPFGIMVPSLPGKKVIGKLDREFITERMHGLTLFCEAIVANPWLRNDTAWLQFMSSTGFANQVGAGPEEMLQKMLETIPLPTLPLDRIYEFKEELNVIDKQMSSVLDATRAVQKAQCQMHVANDTLHQSVESWANAETQSAIYLSGRSHEVVTSSCKLDEKDKVPVMVSSLNALCAERLVATADLAEYSNILFSSFVEHELARSDSFRECIKFHDDLVSSIDSTRVKVEKFETQQASKWDQLQEAKHSLESKIQSINAFYKGLYFFSIPMNAKLRSQNLKKMMSFVGSTILVTSHTMQSSARAFLGKLGANPSQAVADTSHTLDQLSLKPLDPPPDGVATGDAAPPAPCWVGALYAAACGKMYAGSAAAANAVAAGRSAPAYAPPPVPSPQKPEPAAVAAPVPAAAAASTNPFGSADEDEDEEVVTPSVATQPPVVNKQLLGSLLGAEEDEKTKARNADLFG